MKENLKNSLPKQPEKEFLDYINRNLQGFRIVSPKSNCDFFLELDSGDFVLRFDRERPLELFVVSKHLGNAVIDSYGIDSDTSINLMESALDSFGIEQERFRRTFVKKGN